MVPYHNGCHLLNLPQPAMNAGLQEDLCALRTLERSRTELAALVSQLSDLTSAREALVDARYAQLLSAMTTINAKLAEIYRFLTGGSAG